MTPSEYQELAAATDHRDYTDATHRMSLNAHTRFSHYSMGLCTEAAELQDILKKYLAYGKPVDVNHVKEEIGDCLWFISRLCTLFNTTIEELMELNINKLKARYGDKFTEWKALNRNLEEENKILKKEEI